MGSLTKAEDYKNNVGFSERADVPIEPRLSKQWFLKYQVRNRRAIVSPMARWCPERWSKRTITGWAACRTGASVASFGGASYPVWYRGEEIHRLEAPEGEVGRDPDVLDTWCSSWLWPFATMGWRRNKTPRIFIPPT